MLGESLKKDLLRAPQVARRTPKPIRYVWDSSQLCRSARGALGLQTLVWTDASPERLKASLFSVGTSPKGMRERREKWPDKSASHPSMWGSTLIRCAVACWISNGWRLEIWRLLTNSYRQGEAKASPFRVGVIWLGEPRYHIVNPPSNRGVQDAESRDGLHQDKLRCGSGSVGSPCGKGGTSVLIFLTEEIRDVNRSTSDARY